MVERMKSLCTRQNIFVKWKELLRIKSITQFRAWHEVGTQCIINNIIIGRRIHQIYILREFQEQCRLEGLFSHFWDGGQRCSTSTCLGITADLPGPGSCLRTRVMVSLNYSPGPEGSRCSIIPSTTPGLLKAPGHVISQVGPQLFIKWG